MIRSKQENFSSWTSIVWVDWRGKLKRNYLIEKIQLSVLIIPRDITVPE